MGNSIGQHIQMQELVTVIHHIHMIQFLRIKSNFYVTIVIEVYRVRDIFLETIIHIVLNVTKIVLLMCVKNVEEKLALIQKLVKQINGN